MDFSKPRVSLYYYVAASTNYRNDGGSLFLNYNLRRLLDGTDPLKDNDRMMDQNNVVHIQPNMPLTSLGTFDLNILVDHGEDGIYVPLDFTVPRPNAYWVADSHLGYEYRLKRAREFDHVFVSHSPSIEKFIKDGIDPAKIHYLPWAAEETCYRPMPVLEKWDWCFIGTMNNEFRIDLIDRFCKEFPVGEQGYLGWMNNFVKGWNVLDNAATKYSHSRIVLNEAVKDDLNMRVFEALACKRFLLTESVPDLHRHFEDGKHLVTFKTIDEAVEKARYYLAHDEERNRIAEAGHQAFLSHHTYMHRAKEILKVCIGYEAKEKELVAVPA
jgi:glycosyltransferase involved in cell wall biosynthesis